MNVSKNLISFRMQKNIILTNFLMRKLFLNFKVNNFKIDITFYSYTS